MRHDILAYSRSCKNTDDAHQVCLLFDKLKYQLAAFPSNASFRCCAYWLHLLPCPDSYVCWHFVCTGKQIKEIPKIDTTIRIAAESVVAEIVVHCGVHQRVTEQ